MFLYLLHSAHLSVFPESYCSSSLFATTAPKHYPPHTSRCFLPPPTIRMQPLNPNPDNGKSARWSLFPVLIPIPTPQFPKRCMLTVILKLPLSNLVAHKGKRKWQLSVGWGFPTSRPGMNLFPLFACWSQGKGSLGARMEASSPRSFQCCSAPFAQCCAIRPHLREGMGEGS